MINETEYTPCPRLCSLIYDGHKFGPTLPEELVRGFVLDSLICKHGEILFKFSCPDHPELVDSGGNVFKIDGVVKFYPLFVTKLEEYIKDCDILSPKLL
jgi:hypothetical protein